jgi:hypothetical protein
MSNIVIVLASEEVQFTRKNGKMFVLLDKVLTDNFWGTGDNKKTLEEFLKENLEQMVYDGNCNMVTKINCKTEVINPYANSKWKGIKNER